ncbi:MAG TPA: response regulator, partial [Dongiaceae bacterium]|nr:response regulator [Dongiaceae bacterium]
MPHVLIVDDDVDTRNALEKLIRLEGFTVDSAGSLNEARASMHRRRADVVLLDLILPDGEGMELFSDIELRKGTQIVLITGNASIETSIQALRLGATDYLIKPVNIKQLKSILARIDRPLDLKTEISTLREELRRLGRFGCMLGSSPAMQHVYDQISRVAPTVATVLITGESGTGKELVAQTLHSLSNRHHAPFLAVNCGAISPQLIESEM